MCIQIIYTCIIYVRKEFCKEVFWEHRKHVYNKRGCVRTAACGTCVLLAVWVLFYTNGRNCEPQGCIVARAVQGRRRKIALPRLRRRGTVSAKAPRLASNVFVWYIARRSAAAGRTRTDTRLRWLARLSFKRSCEREVRGNHFFTSVFYFSAFKTASRKGRRFFFFGGGGFLRPFLPIRFGPTAHLGRRLQTVRSNSRGEGDETLSRPEIIRRTVD